MGKKIPPDWSELGDPLIGKRRWRLGELEFDETSRELRLRGERVAIEPKPLDCLMALLRRPNDVIKKQDLCRWVWSGRHVSESVLTKSIAKLRIAIDDENQQIVKTVHGYGYRLVAMPREVEPEHPQIELKARQLLPKHPEIRLLRRIDEASNLWSAELSSNQEPRLLCAALEASALPTLRREYLFSRRLAEHPATSSLALPIREWNLDHAPYFIAREPLVGALLPEWLAQNQRLQSARMDERLFWLADLCDAVACVHEAGLHFEGRLNPDCFVVLNATDRLQCKLVLGAVATWRTPERAQVLVPERYRGPELLEGLQPGPAADVFALGVIGYHLLTNRWSAALAPGWETLLADRLVINILARATQQNLAQRLPGPQMLAQLLRELPQARIVEAQARSFLVERRSAPVTAAVPPAPAHSAAPAMPAKVAEPPPLPAAKSAYKERGRWQAATLVGVVSFFSLLVSALRGDWLKPMASQELRRAEAVNNFWGESLLPAFDAFESPEKVREWADMLDRAAQVAQRRFAENPQVQLAITQTICRAYAQLGLYDKALELAQARVRLAVSSAPKVSSEPAEAQLQLVGLLIAAGRPQSVSAALAALPTLISKTPKSAREAQQGRAEFLRAQSEEMLGQYARASARLQQLLATPPASNSVAEQDRLAATQTVLARAELGMGRWREAEASVRAALAWYDRGRSGDPESYVAAAETEFRLLLQQQRIPALAAAGERFKAFVHNLPEPRRMAVVAQFHQAEQLLAARHPAESLKLAEVVLRERRRVYDPAHCKVLASAALVIRSRLALGQAAESLPLAREAVARATEGFGAGHPHSLLLTTLLADGLQQSGNTAEAETLLRQSLQLAGSNLPPNNLIRVNLHTQLGDLLAATNPEAAREQWQLARQHLPTPVAEQGPLLQALEQRLNATPGTPRPPVEKAAAQDLIAGLQ